MGKKSNRTGQGARESKIYPLAAPGAPVIPAKACTQLCCKADARSFRMPIPAFGQWGNDFVAYIAAGEAGINAMMQEMSITLPDVDERMEIMLVLRLENTNRVIEMSYDAFVDAMTGLGLRNIKDPAFWFAWQAAF